MTQHRSGFAAEMGIIPTGWTAAAAFFFAALQVMFLVMLPRYLPNEVPPQPWLSVIGSLVGLLVAAIVLLTGYIYADARRRGMNAVLWVVLVILIPKPFGYIAYFLLRKPLLVACLQCGTAVGRDFAYCPKCRYALSPSCANCGRMVKPDYVVCPYCGKTVTGTSLDFSTGNSSQA